MFYDVNAHAAEQDPSIVTKITFLHELLMMFVQTMALYIGFCFMKRKQTMKFMT